MFTKRHEQELAEIKATTHELVQRFEEIVQQLERIKQNQDELAAAAQQGRTGRAGKRRTGGRRSTEGGRRGRRRAGNSDSTEE
jgi:phage shock protein A